MYVSSFLAVRLSGTICRVMWGTTELFCNKHWQLVFSFLSKVLIFIKTKVPGASEIFALRNVATEIRTAFLKLWVVIKKWEEKWKNKLFQGCLPNRKSLRWNSTCSSLERLWCILEISQVVDSVTAVWNQSEVWFHFIAIAEENDTWTFREMLHLCYSIHTRLPLAHNRIVV